MLKYVVRSNHAPFLLLDQMGEKGNKLKAILKRRGVVRKQKCDNSV